MKSVYNLTFLKTGSLSFNTDSNTEIASFSYIVVVKKTKASNNLSLAEIIRIIYNLELLLFGKVKLGI